jgi:hypothetical protein
VCYGIFGLLGVFLLEFSLNPIEESIRKTPAQSNVCDNHIDCAGRKSNNIDEFKNQGIL